MDSNNQIIIYQTEDGQTQVDVRLENETVWLTQKQIAELFGTIYITNQVCMCFYAMNWPIR